jgi:hypothetical protein
MKSRCHLKSYSRRSVTGVFGGVAFIARSVKLSLGLAIIRNQNALGLYKFIFGLIIGHDEAMMKAILVNREVSQLIPSRWDYGRDSERYFII